MRQWHWISSAVCLVGMLMFALTGITLNHAGRIEASPQVTTLEAELPSERLLSLEAVHAERAPLPDDLRAWFADEWQLRLPARAAEWDGYEVYLSLPRPGGDAWLSIDRVTGDVLYERTDRGWIALFNDLHKGRNTGTAWSWFIDIFAVACVIFSITGLVLLKRHAANRPTTWPLVGLGLVIPWILIVFLLH
ncbi:PepSY-associated TM helix domain-containing protein [Marinimicrobium alkaliphilum]|uniref:PepSY-associated TM helix domain-containing protein n=1 Tax=Marinimicrobium alkaliphilum TaxID=2202654 RepID=UPI001E3CDA5B|nr:PepSY-associated TM helix domain-containing protein [Marinimicrobium alkaliphilum]